MSASREKKNRQELAAQGYVDPKVIREAEEKAAQKKSKIIYGIIAAVFVIVAIGSWLISSGVLQRNAKAISIDGEEFTAAEMSYYYNAAYNNVANSQYGSYMGLNTSAPLDSQVVNETAKMFLGLETEEEMTWHEYFLDAAKDNMVQIGRLYDAAIDAGEDPNDAHVIEEIDATVELIGQYASQSGMSTKEYLRAVYGKNMTVDLFRQIVSQIHVASHFESEYIASLTYDVAELEAYYSEHQADFDVAAYESLYFAGTPEVKKDDEGNTIEATDAEKAAAKEAAAADAAAALERVQAGEKLEDVAKDYASASYTNTETGTNTGSDTMNWVFDAARVDGDSTVINGDPAATVVVFHSVGRQDYNTIDVRHILVQVDTSGLDKESESYEADEKALWDEAKAEAEKILADWKAGVATEESFGEMAAELSDDGADHGLYENVYKGQMVENFEDWCFDSARAVGDTGIVETPYGYHVMYFVGENAPYWQTQVENAKMNEDYTAWIDGLTADAEVVELSGIKHVG